MRRSLLWLAISLLIPLPGNSLFGQAVQSQSKLGWATLVLGYGAGNAEEAGALGLEGSFQHGGHLFSGRLLGFSEPLGEHSEGSEAALLYGRIRHGEHHHMALSAGVAYLRCQGWAICGDPDWENPDHLGFYYDSAGDYRRTAGLALAGQVFWTPAGWFGLGLYGFANINPQASFVGVMLGLRFGKLRK